MRFLILTLALVVTGCATFSKDYSRFQEASMCMDGPTRLFRDPDLKVCWFVVGQNSIVTADCDALNKMTYCKPRPQAAQPKQAQPQGEQQGAKDDKSKDAAKKTTPPPTGK